MTDVATSDVSSDAKNTAEQDRDRSTTERALERISVSAPYFALSDLTETGPGIVSAIVPATPTSDPETGTMEAAQVARHLAILGSCAAALSRADNKRHHYLATRAHYTRLSSAGSVHLAKDEPLHAEAIASWVDRRTARAIVKLSTTAGQGLNVLDVEYTVLAKKMFSRLHPPVDPAVRGNKGGHSLAFEPTKTETGVTVDCGRIPESMCDGHFADYPAAPVAILMGQLCRAAGHGLAGYLGIPELRYRIEEGRVVATKLAAAGQRLELVTNYNQPVAGGHQVTGHALADGEVVGELEVTMSTSAPRPEPAEGFEELQC